MKRGIGYVIFYGGLLLVLLAWLFEQPSRIGVNGHYVAAFWVEIALGFLLAVCGVALVGTTRTARK